MSAEKSAAPRRTPSLLPGNVPHWAAPWLTCAAAPPVAFVAHEIWANDAAMHTGLGAVAVFTTAVTWAAWGRRHEHTRAMATAFAAGVTGWTAFAANTPLTGQGLWDTWMLGTLGLGAGWNVISASHNPKHETDKPSERHDGMLQKIGGALKDARVRRTKEQPGRLEADIELAAGQVNESVQGQTGEIASMAGVGKGQVTVVPSRRNARKLKLVFQNTENLKTSVKWPGPGKYGRSIADAPLDIGMRADGSRLELWIVGQEDPENPRQLPHTLVTGVNGSGKTATVVTAILRMRERGDVVPIVGDPAKFPQSFGNVADALAIAAKTPQQVKQLIRNLVDLVPYRAELLGNLVRSDGTIGYDQWEPECYTLHKIPLVFVDIEEATDVLGDDETIDAAVRKLRSIGASLCVSLQSAHHGNIPRKARGQFTNSLAHGCREMYDARFALSDGTLDAGADPTKWQNNYAGSLYGELVGTDPATWAMEARAYFTDRIQRRAEVAASKANGHWAVLDPGTAAILGRGIPMQDEQVTALLPPVPMDKPEPQVSEPEPELEDEAEDLTTRTTEDGEEIDVSMAIPKPKVNIPLAQPERDRMGTDEARALVEARIDELELMGQTTITFKNLGDLMEATGRNRSWFYEELKRLVQDGRLAAGSSGRAPYRLRPRVLNGTR